MPRSVAVSTALAVCAVLHLLCLLGLCVTKRRSSAGFVLSDVLLTRYVTKRRGSWLVDTIGNLSRKPPKARAHARNGEPINAGPQHHSRRKQLDTTRLRLDRPCPPHTHCPLLGWLRAAHLYSHVLLLLCSSFAQRSHSSSASSLRDEPYTICV